MINKVFLLWDSYRTGERLVIGSLRKENNKYIFKYEKDAFLAKSLGCLLPLIDENKEYDEIPQFFSRRMLTSEYNKKLFDINYSSDNKLALLAFGGSIKNSDNFSIISEDVYNSVYDDEQKISMHK